MNDTDVIKEVRERFGEIHMSTSLETLMRVVLPVGGGSEPSSPCCATAVYCKPVL